MKKLISVNNISSATITDMVIRTKLKLKSGLIKMLLYITEPVNASLKTVIERISNIKFLCSEAMMLKKALVGDSIRSVIVAQRSMFGILSLVEYLHDLQIFL